MAVAAKVSSTYTMQSPLGNTIPGNHPEVSQDSKLEPDESEEMSETTPRADLEILQGILGLREKADNKERWDNVVLVCVDCEAYENDPRKVTEVGISILDTSELETASIECPASGMLADARVDRRRH